MSTVGSVFGWLGGFEQERSLGMHVHGLDGGGREGGARNSMDGTGRVLLFCRVGGGGCGLFRMVLMNFSRIVCRGRGMSYDL